jgi:hypothetical protein
MALQPLSISAFTRVCDALCDLGVPRSAVVTRRPLARLFSIKQAHADGRYLFLAPQFVVTAMR